MGFSPSRGPKGLGPVPDRDQAHRAVAPLRPFQRISRATLAQCQRTSSSTGVPSQDFRAGEEHLQALRCPWS